MSGVTFKRGWCPSLLWPMESGDGWLVRVRPRDAVITADLAYVVADAASRYGSGRIEITNRANLQIRGLRTETVLPFVKAMEAVGAVDGGEGPGRILLSPLVAADPGSAPDTLAIAQTIADGLLEEQLPPLPAKFGVLVDGGGALPLTGLSLDITLRAAENGRWRVNGVECRAEAAAPMALALAAALAQAPRLVPERSGKPPVLGFHAYGKTESGFLLLAPPFGHFYAAGLAALAGLASQLGDGMLRPTPWKSLAVAGLRAADAGSLCKEANRLGMITDRADPRLGIVTCVGAPACLRGAADTHGAAIALAAARRADDPLLHLSGCAKGCAHPGAAPLTLVGTEGVFDLIRDGRPADRPAARHLTLAQIHALMQSVT